MKNKIRVVSLFSGIGGFEQGLDDSIIDGNIIFSSEIEKFAKTSYLINYPNHNLHGDITQINEDDIPNHDILMGGFPCQAFSIAGKRNGFSDTRGTLFFDIARILKAKQPKVVFLENVENLINHDNSNTIRTILYTLQELGYTVDFTIINSSEMGLPQNRTRTYIIGIKNYSIEKYVTDQRSPKIDELKRELNKVNFHSFNFFSTLKSLDNTTVIADILEESVAEKYYFNNDKIKSYLETFIYEASPKSKKIIKLFDLPKDIHNDQERQRRVHSIKGISPTVLARSDTTKILIETQDGLKIRKLTPTENLRTQGFNELFIQNLKNAGVSDTQLYKQSGNAVSPPVIREIFNHLYHFINSNSNNFSFIDLFAGIGGFRIALESSGGTCVFSSEIDKYARETYKSNFGEEPSGDIFQISSEMIPNHDVLCAGFPCQPFSIAGRRLGFEDARGTLFFEVARIIRDKRPKAFILENVAGLVSHDNRRTLDTIINILEDLQYNVSWKLLNAKEYGVPQNRNRWYCVGIDKNHINTVDFKEIFPEKHPLEYTLRDIIKPTFSNDYIVSNIAINNMNTHIDTFLNKTNSKIVKGEPIIANNIRPSKVSFSANGISPCLTAKMGTGGNNVPVIYGVNRKLTTNECLQIMGFPKNYKLKENYSQSYKQLGNSVVVSIIQQITENLVKKL